MFLTKNERGALFGPRWRCRFHVGAGAERPRVLPQAASSPESAPPHRAAARALPGPGRAPSCHQRSCFLFVLLLCCFLAVTPEPALLCASTLGLALFPALSRASKSVSVSVSINKKRKKMTIWSAYNLKGLELFLCPFPYLLSTSNLLTSLGEFISKIFLESIYCSPFLLSPPLSKISFSFSWIFVVAY